MRLRRTVEAALIAACLTGCGGASEPAVVVHIAAPEEPPSDRPVPTEAVPRRSSAGIQPGAVHLIAIRTDDADDQADALTRALRAAVRELPRWATKSWSLADGDYSLEVLELSLRCPDPPDTDCQARIADQIKSDQYIWGTLRKENGAQVSGTLHLWVRGRGTSEVSLEYSATLVDPGGEPLRNLAREALHGLLTGRSTP
jgi:hypothetical protein